MGGVAAQRVRSVLLQDYGAARMTEPTTEPLPPIPRHGAVIVRRLIARLIDDGFLAALAAVCLTIGVRVGESETSGRIEPDRARDLEYFGIALGSYPLALLVSSTLLLVLVVGYYAVASHTDKGTPGRRFVRLRVVRADGRAPTPSALLGREFLRLALVGLSLALVWSITSPLAVAALALQQPIGEIAGLWIAVVLTAVPTGLVVAGWVGAAAVDDEGRAPHDRLARTRVVRR